MPNIGRNASANSIGTVNRIEPPHNDNINDLMRSGRSITQIV